jgi:hypothetical protein
MQIIRRRRLAAGGAHADVEEELQNAQKLTSLAALAFFDDKERGGDVLTRLNRIGAWAGDVYRNCKDGAHGKVSVDLKTLIENTGDLCKRVLDLK